MPKQQLFRLGRTIFIASIGINIFTGWALIPAFIGWGLLVYGASE